MKKIIMIALMAIAAYGAQAQVQPNSTQQPTTNPNVPNQYQNNATYNNNSMQNNRPQNPNAPNFPGSAGYTDPTGANRGSAPLNNNNMNNNINQLPNTNSINPAATQDPLWQNNPQVVQPGGLIMPGDTLRRNQPIRR